MADRTFPFPKPTLKPDQIAMHPSEDFWTFCYQFEAYLDFYGKCVDREYLNDTRLRAYALVKALPQVGYLGNTRRTLMEVYAEHTTNLEIDPEHDGGGRFPHDMQYELVFGRLGRMVVSWERASPKSDRPWENREVASEESGVGKQSVGSDMPSLEEARDEMDVVVISDDEEEAMEDSEMEEGPIGGWLDVEESDSEISDIGSSSSDRSSSSSSSSDSGSSSDVEILSVRQAPAAHEGRRGWARIGDRVKRVI